MFSLKLILQMVKYPSILVKYRNKSFFKWVQSVDHRPLWKPFSKSLHFHHLNQSNCIPRHSGMQESHNIVMYHLRLLHLWKLYYWKHTLLYLSPNQWSFSLAPQFMCNQNLGHKKVQYLKILEFHNKDT